MKELRVNRWDIEAAMNPPQDLHGMEHYLDRETGEVLWLYEEDWDYQFATGEPAEDNAKLKRRVDTEPERHLLIVPLDQSDFQKMLRDFLLTDWTTDKDRWQDAYDAYNGAIGRWKRRVRDRDAIHAFREYESEQILKRGEEFLRENGVIPVWK